MTLRPLIVALAATIALPLADLTVFSGGLDASVQAQDRGRGRGRDDERKAERKAERDAARDQARDQARDARRQGRDRQDDDDVARNARRNAGNRDDDNRGRGRGCIDLDRDGRCDSASTVCRDTDNDGLCDGRGRGPDDADLCVDANRNGRCDVASALPDMLSAITLRNGNPSRTAWWWLADRDVRRVRWIDRNNDGVPEMAFFRDARGRLVQGWWDTNGDGLADRVQLYRNGRPFRVIGV